MATYKKRSRKNTSKSNLDPNLSSTKQVFETLDEGASKTELFVNRYQKYLVGFITFLVLVFVIYFSYNKFILQPKVNESNTEIFTAQKYFNEAVNADESSDSLFSLSLLGAEGKFGFLDIIENYSGTPAANLSYYYSGIAYYNMEKFDLAIKYLNSFKSEDKILSALAMSTIGDSFVQLNQLEDGLIYFEKALSKADDNSFIKPIVLLKSGNIALHLNKKSKARNYFQQIKDDFPNSPQADTIDINIAQTQ
tara:strand:+ start:650 stop:1402 length:753 start_codon:yes stop_codon:yes gene_type:complete